MILHISGNINEYYVQTLCMLFFPGEKFSKTITEKENTPEAFIDIRPEGDGVCATVTLKEGEKAVTKSQYEPLRASDKVSAERIACGKAFLAAGGDLTGIYPSWGILTGVRPAKLAMEEIEKGKTSSEIEAFLSEEYLVSPKKASLVTEIARTEHRLFSRVGEKTCSLYISIPFCPSRCSYCSFVSCTSAKLLKLLDPYLERLCLDFHATMDTVEKLGLTVSTVYIGGGTPTTLNETQLRILLDTVTSRIDPSSLEEFTVEAGRPDTITEEKLHIIRSHGVTRVSINTQTLNDEVLARVGRKHTAAEFYRAFEMAKNVGIPHINTDLIAGLPGESFNSFAKTVDELIRLRPDNLTFHTLCIKNAADFAHSRDSVYNRELNETSKCVDYSQARAKEVGYLPYYIYRQKNTIDNLENVGYALAGAEGLYNIYMMEEIHSIFAVGAGAVSKLVSRDRRMIDRIFEYKYPYEYLSDSENGKNAEKEKKILDFYRNIF